MPAVKRKRRLRKTVLAVALVIAAACAAAAVYVNTSCRSCKSGGTVKTVSVSQASSQAPASSAASKTSSLPSPESDPLYAQAYACYAAKQYDKAIAYCDTAIAQNANCYWAYNVKGASIYYANGNSAAQSCIALIDKSIAIAPDYSYAYFNKALIYKGLKQNDESISLFLKVISLKPEDAWSYYGISTIYADENNTAKSLEYLKKAIEYNPDCKTEAKTEYHYDRMRSDPGFIALVGS
jgi:tetratricopeptide (TPR) repeat protein